MTDCRWLTQPVSTISTNIGTSSVTGGTTISATLVERKSRWPGNRPKTTAYAARSAISVDTATDETVTRRLFHIHRGIGLSITIARNELSVGCDGTPVGSSWYAVFDFSAVATMKYRG